MRFIIYGAGGIGATIGARLSQQGADVTLIARGEHLAALQRKGLHFIAPDGEHRLKFPVFQSPSESEWRGDEVVLLCVKSQDTYAALSSLKKCVSDTTPIVCIQNGVANEEMALRFFSKVYAGHVFVPTSFLSPGVVVTYGNKPAGVIDIGCYPDGVDDLCRELCRCLTAAGFSSHADLKVMEQKYAKLLSNLNNAFQVLLPLDADSTELSMAVNKEAIACYQAAGIKWTPEPQAKERWSLGLAYQEVPGYPRPGGSSWQSIKRGASEVETDFLNGEIVLLGRKYGVPTPVNLALQRMTNEVAQKKLPLGSFTVEDIRLRIESHK